MVFKEEGYNSDNHKQGFRANIPYKIEDGMYYIKDRYNNPDHIDENILTRYSFNYTISILDLDSNKVYIYKLDT